MKKILKILKKIKKKSFCKFNQKF